MDVPDAATCWPLPAGSTATCAASTRTRSRRSRNRRSAERLWSGPFVQLGNSKVEASFADHRTYIYKGKEVDQQVHLGFDLAVTAHVPVRRSQRRHGRQRQLARHLRQLRDHRSRPGRAVALRPPDVVRREGRAIGSRAGRRSAAATRPGLAGGDHLHFTMLVGGRMVNPVEWWDPHWIQDRVDRKLGEQLARSGNGHATVAIWIDLSFMESIIRRGTHMRLRNAHTGVFWLAVSARGFGRRVRRQQTGGTTWIAAAAVPQGSGRQKVDAATAGELKGTVMIDGMAPKNEAIKMNADPVCLREAKGRRSSRKPTRSAADGKSLANVFVYVKDGLGNYSYDTPTSQAVIDQKECRYHPHVFGMRVGQPLEIINDDPTLHNIHALPKNNAEFNNGQPIQGMKMTHTFDKPEVMVPFKCDVHGWMNAYVGVLDHPVLRGHRTPTASSTSRRCRPARTRSRRGTRSSARMQQTVTIGEKETKDVELHVQGAGAATGHERLNVRPGWAGRAGGAPPAWRLPCRPFRLPSQRCSTALPSSSPAARCFCCSPAASSRARAPGSRCPTGRRRTAGTCSRFRRQCGSAASSTSTATG